MTLFPCFNAWVIFHCEPVSHSLSHSSLHPCILSLLSSLGIGNAAIVHALGCEIFKIHLFLKCPRSGKTMSYYLFLSFFLPSFLHSFIYFILCVKALGQWFTHWLLPLIWAHVYKRIPLTNNNLSFLVWIVFHGSLFHCSELISLGGLDFISLVPWHWDNRCIQVCLFSPTCY